MPKKALTSLLKSIEQKSDLREGVKDTPERVIESYKHIFSGYEKDLQKIIGSRFLKSENNDIILFDNIDFFSMCEHHMMPFYGKIQIGYMPSTKLISFGRIEELVNAVTRKLQIQERIAREIAEGLQASELKPLGVVIKISAKHFCTFSKAGASTPKTMKNIITTGALKDPKFLPLLKAIR